MGQVGAESVPIADAAHSLGMSVRTAKREVETGRLRSFRTSGGHLRVLKSDVEAFRQGITTPASAPASSVLQNKREGVEELRAELHTRKLKRELSKLDAEDATAESERVQAARTQRLAVKAKLADVHLQREKNAQQEDRERRQRDRDQWRRAWINGARKEFPDWLSVGQQQALLASVETELGLSDMGDSQDSIGQSLDRIIERVIAPWRAEREAKRTREESERQAAQRRESLIDRTMWFFPVQATDREKLSAIEAARAALMGIPLSASEWEVQTAIKEAVGQGKQAVERRLEAERIRAEAAQIQKQAKWNEELARAKEKFETQQREFKKQTLIFFGESRVVSYLRELHAAGEIDREALNDASWLDLLKTEVRQTIEREFDGTESTNTAQELACELVDGELE